MSKPSPLATKSLSIHPDVADFPELTPEQYSGLKDSVAKHGILQPLVISKLQVVDGRHRLRAAQDLGLATVPVIDAGNANPLDHAIESAIARRQLTKSGIVLVLWEKHPALATERRERMKAGKRDPVTGVTGSGLAERYGVPRQYFSLIAAIWDATNDKKWAEVREAILVQELSIPRIRAGVAGAGATVGAKKNPTNYFNTCRTGLVSIREGFKNWKRISVEQKVEIKKLWDEVQKFVPGDLE